MTAQAEPTTKAYCNVLALEKGLDPAGHAGSFNDAVLIETPLPWKKDIYQQADPLPQEALNLMALWLQRYHETGEYGHRPLLIAPDAEYSRPGQRWVMFYTHKPGAFAHYDKVSYSVPVDEVGPLLWAWYESPVDLPHFDMFRAPEADSQRDILVCTHGTIDAACAKFGYPLYNGLRRQHADDGLHVWRVSHFGGHVFAPTLMDMPTGHYWAYVEEAQARQIAARDGEVSALRGHYRGWAGLKSSFLQAAEYELWQRHGWAWFGWDKHGEILAEDDTDPDDPLWADVRITHTTPDGAEVAHVLRVEVRNHVETITTTGYDKTYHYPQYVVTACERVG
ncbi:MAG: sucrase ferredoxin [Anaerolineae bacterium]|jgi:hypothetical protein|nr:sucrase ferredoxin [Anaerolineae bacterium]